MCLSPIPCHVPARRILAILAGVVVLEVTARIVSGYGAYFAADFTNDLLRGREGQFRGAYRWAFFAHILSGPAALVMGLFLVSDSARARFPAWHRRVGRVQVACVLLVVAPSGLGMARYAAAGPVGALGLASLGGATAACAAMGLRAALARRFGDHRRWMWRCYLLLASAVVLRLAGGLAVVVGVHPPWFDPLATWACWLGPLLIFEARDRVSARRDGLTTR